MSPFSSLISASTLAITVALAGAASTASLAAPLPPSKPDAAHSSSRSSGTQTVNLNAPAPRPAQAAPTIGSSSNVSRADLERLKVAVDAARRSRASEALSVAAQIQDPVARKLVYWMVIRQSPNDFGFDNIAAFIQENPGWPTQSTLRRRAERVLFQENRNHNRALQFFAQQPPLSGEGKVALARALAANGNRSDAAQWVRGAWREDNLNERFENTILEEFGNVITRADHKARAERFTYEKDSATAMRAASRAGSDVVALTRAGLAVANRDDDANKYMNAVPSSLRNDPAYLFARSQVLRRADKNSEAARALLAGVSTANAQLSPDAWWMERRFLSRKLLEEGQARAAYQVAATGVTPTSDNYRAEQEFTSGWIALRFLNDPRTAAAHFARVAHGQKNPIALARAYYWQGRAAEAQGSNMQARNHYQNAANYSWTYYGQLARTRLGATPVSLRKSPSASFSEKQTFARMEPVQAIRMLYAIGDRTTPMTIYYDLAWRLDNPAHISLLSELAKSNSDPRGALVAGKEGVAMGHPVERDAYPTFGIPRYSPIGDRVETAAVYAITRQESQFNPSTLSSANAMGLMQVTPAAGRQVSRLTGVPYNESKLRSDQSYNVQFGAAELGELVRLYDNNYVLAFAAYNAGRGNVRRWIERFGDPRDPQVDVVDWVELIPFSETRNYVQRVMENYQSYKVLFDSPNRLRMEADMRGSR